MPPDCPIAPQKSNGRQETTSGIEALARSAGRAATAFTYSFVVDIYTIATPTTTSHSRLSPTALGAPARRPNSR